MSALRRGLKPRFFKTRNLHSVILNASTVTTLVRMEGSFPRSHTLQTL
jgi:hypothetical protein